MKVHLTLMVGWLNNCRMKIPKILIVNNGLAGGGIERASVSLANYFSGLGYQVDVLALYQSKPFFILDAKASFTEPDFIKKDNGKYFYVIKMMFYVRAKIKQVDPDVILAFGEWTNPFVIMSVMGLNIPIYVSDRMNPLAKLPWISEILKKVLYKKATGIIAQSAFAKDILQKKTNSNNIKIINNPVNAIDKIQCEPKKRIVTVGRLSPEKGHRFLIEAFAMLKNTNWELSIVGDGIEMSKLKKLAAYLYVTERVIFHGHLIDFRQQLSEAQIFVLPSLSEGFPNALIEAMSVPLACISTNFFQGKNEIIEHGLNGLIVEPGNVDELAAAIEKLIVDEGLRQKLAKNAYKVREDLQFEKIANQYLDFILPKNV